MQLTVEEIASEVVAKIRQENAKKKFLDYGEVTAIERKENGGWKAQVLMPGAETPTIPLDCLVHYEPTEGDWVAVMFPPDGSSQPIIIGEAPARENTVVTPGDRFVEAGVQFEVNVKDFGAKGDGGTDDSDAINAAIAYAATNGISTVVFPKGTFVIKKTIYLVNRKDLIIRSDKATIKLGGTAEIIMLDISGAENITWEKVKLDGSKENIVTLVTRPNRKPMVYCSNSCKSVEFVKSTFRNAAGPAMTLYGFTDGLIDDNLFEDLEMNCIGSFNNAGNTRIINNRMRNGWGKGITMQGHNGTVEYVEIQNNQIKNLKRDPDTNVYGMGIEFNVNVNRVFVTDNKIQSMGDMGISISGVNDGIVSKNYVDSIGTLGVSGYGAGLELIGCTAIQAVNNIIKNTTRSNIVVDKAKYNLITNNILTQPYKTDYTNECYGIFGAGSSTTTNDGNVITGNRIEGGTYGIYFTGYTTNLKMSDNTFIKCYAAGYASTNTTNSGVELINNKFIGCFVVIQGLVGIELKLNTFDGTGGVGYRGIRLYGGNQKVNITENTFQNLKYGVEFMEAASITKGVIRDNEFNTTDGAFAGDNATNLVQVRKKDNDWNYSPLPDSA